MNRPSLLLIGGTVVDGTGREPWPADVLIEGERIGAVVEPAAGWATSCDAKVVDVTGRMVCPGFIDVHSHDDLAVCTHPTLDYKVSQGVTTVIVGNCGIGVVPLDDQLRSDLLGSAGLFSAVLGPTAEIPWSTFDDYAHVVEASSPSVNVGVLAPHNVIRRMWCGPNERPAAPNEVLQMSRTVAQLVEAGALGLSTGLAYSPGRAADRAELNALARAAVEAGGLYVSHIRDEADRVTEALAEALSVGEEAGRPAHISHLKALGRSNWGKAAALIDRIVAAEATCDAYPYTAASTLLREALIAGGATTPIQPADVIIAYSINLPEAVGRSLAAVCEHWGMSVQQAVERLESPTPGTSVVYFGMSSDDVASVLGNERCMFGTDGVPTFEGLPHPRLFGTFPRILGRYVRERGELSFTEAVRRAAAFPAHVFGLEGRGKLEPGFFADIAVIDPTRVIDTATYDEPKQFSVGVDLVVVNGEPTWQSGRHTGARSGRMLRRGSPMKA